MTSKFFVKFNVDGRPGGEIIVEARDSSAARRTAMAELNCRAGYSGKKIAVTMVMKAR